MPIIMVSAFNDVDGIAKCIQLGAQDYLPKEAKIKIAGKTINASWIDQAGDLRSLRFNYFFHYSSLVNMVSINSGLCIRQTN